MRAAYAVFLFIALLILAGALHGSVPSDPADPELAEEMNPILWFAPVLLPSLALPILFAFAVRGRGWLDVHGMGVAARTAVGLGILGMLIPLGGGFGVNTLDSPTPGDFPPPISEGYGYMFCGLAAGALLFESLRNRAARRSGEIPPPVIGDGTLLFAAALGFLGIFLLFVGIQ